VSDLVLDASLALQWFLEDETGRQYSTAQRPRKPFHQPCSGSDPVVL
jgi:hypothetical protein